MLIIYTMAICIIRQDHSDEHKIEISDATVTPWEDIKTEATVE